LTAEPAAAARGETSIRPATPGERPRLEALLVEASAALGYSDDLVAEIRRHAPDDPALAPEAFDDGRVLVAVERGLVLGFAAVDPPDADGHSELTGLFVAPAAWRRGIGSRLVDAASELAATWGAVALRVVGSTEFYLRTGWRIVAETGTPLGEPAWVLERPIVRER